MRKVIYIVSIILLFINGISACFGGISLILDPTGEWIGLSLHKLQFLPFKNYLLPGILLLFVNGISSLVIAIIIIRKPMLAPWLLIIQGCVLICWIIVQSLSIPFDILQYIFAIIGIIMTISGFILSTPKIHYQKTTV